MMMIHCVLKINFIFCCQTSLPSKFRHGIVDQISYVDYAAYENEKTKQFDIFGTKNVLSLQSEISVKPTMD